MWWELEELLKIIQSKSEKDASRGMGQNLPSLSKKLVESMAKGHLQSTKPYSLLRITVF